MKIGNSQPNGYVPETSDNKDSQIQALEAQISRLLKQQQKAGEKGNQEEQKRLEQQIQQLKQRLEQLKQRANQQAGHGAEPTGAATTKPASPASLSSGVHVDLLL